MNLLFFFNEAAKKLINYQNYFYELAVTEKINLN